MKNVTNGRFASLFRPRHGETGKASSAPRAAFSLIELLIVITIIGILAVAFLPSITSGPSRARDVQRISDLSDVALALELYFQDVGQYPDADDNNIPADTLASYFDNGQIPSDPTPSLSVLESSSGEYYYEVSDNNQAYALVADVENTKVNNPGYYTADSITNPVLSAQLAAAEYSSDDTYYVITKN